MNGHWSESATTIRRYQGIESRLEVQRPIAFLIATNRTFNLEAFCDSLLESLRGSRVLAPGKEGLLHLYLASEKSVPTLLPQRFQGFLTYTPLPFHEKESNNIGATRKRQIELAELPKLPELRFKTRTLNRNRDPNSRRITGITRITGISNSGKFGNSGNSGNSTRIRVPVSN